MAYNSCHTHGKTVMYKAQHANQDSVGKTFIVTDTVNILLILAERWIMVGGKSRKDSRKEKTQILSLIAILEISWILYNSLILSYNGTVEYLIAQCYKHLRLRLLLWLNGCIDFYGSIHIKWQ